MSDHLFHQSSAALMCDEEEDYDEAIRALTNHLVGNPSNASAYNNRGWRTGKSGRSSGR
jgi:hypothetical protein